MLKRIADILLAVGLIYATLTTGFVTGVYWVVKQRSEEIISAIQDINSSRDVLARKLKDKPAEWWAAVISASLPNPCFLSMVVEKKTFQECKARAIKTIAEQQKIMKFGIATNLMLLTGVVLFYATHILVSFIRKRKGVA